jgi:hypothetical protein
MYIIDIVCQIQEAKKYLSYRHVTYIEQVQRADCPGNLGELGLKTRKFRQFVRLVLHA